MDLSTRTEGDVLVARVNASRIDAACAVQFKDAMAALASAPQSRVILDLEDVEFLDSSGLGAVVAVFVLVWVASNFVGDDDETRAKREMTKLILEKTRKGYVEE